MKLWIKIAIGVLTGFAGGFATGFFVHKKMNDVEFEEISEEEMAALEGQAKDLIKEAFPEGDDKGVSVHGRLITDEDLPKDPDKLRINLQGKVSYIQADNDAKEKYSSIWNTVQGYSNEDNANELPVPAVEESEADGVLDEEGFDSQFIEEITDENEESHHEFDKRIYEIDIVDFYDSTNGFDKITIDWYEPNTFLDEREETIADLTTYIGDIDVEKIFNERSQDEDPDVRFIRNEAYSTDYEIVRHHRTWSEATGGSV